MLPNNILIVFLSTEVKNSRNSIRLKPLALLEQTEVSVLKLNTRYPHNTSVTSYVKKRKQNSLWPINPIQSPLVSVTLEQLSIMQLVEKPLLECLLQSLLWTWKVIPLPFSCERPSLWKPDTWLLLLPVRPFCTPPSSPRHHLFRSNPFPLLMKQARQKPAKLMLF